MDIDLRKAEVQHRFLQIKQSRSLNFFWASFIYSIIIWFFVVMSLIELGVSKKPIYIVSAILWIASLVKITIREKTYLNSLRRKFFTKKDNEVEVIDFKEE